MALTPLVTPGPGGQHGEPGHPGQLAGGLGGERRGLLVAHVEQPHRRVGLDRAVVHREDVRAGQREHGLDAVRPGDGDGELAAVAARCSLGHGRHACRSEVSAVSGLGAAGSAGWWRAARRPRRAAGRSGPRAAAARARAGGSSARRKASALPPLEVRVALVDDARAPAAGREPGDPRLEHPQRDEVAAQHRHRRARRAGRARRCVNSRSTGSSSRSASTSRSTVSSLAAEVRRLGQRAERVGAVRDRVRPALAGHEAAQVALAEQPGRDPVAPLEDLAARQQRPLVVAGDALAEDQRGEAAPEDRVGAVLAEPDAEPGGHPVAEAGEQVVVDAAVDPGGQRG